MQQFDSEKVTLRWPSASVPSQALQCCPRGNMAESNHISFSGWLGGTVVKTMSSGPTSRQQLLIALWPWASNLNPLCFSFLICKQYSAQRLLWRVYMSMSIKQPGLCFIQIKFSKNLAVITTTGIIRSHLKEQCCSVGIDNQQSPRLLQSKRKGSKTVGKVCDRFAF